MQLRIDDGGSFLYAPIVGPGQLGHVRICPMDLSILGSAPWRSGRRGSNPQETMKPGSALPTSKGVYAEI
jgi:hypothetical protein